MMLEKLGFGEKKKEIIVSAGASRLLKTKTTTTTNSKKLQQQEQLKLAKGIPAAAASLPPTAARVTGTEEDDELDLYDVDGESFDFVNTAELGNSKLETNKKKKNRLVLAPGISNNDDDDERDNSRTIQTSTNEISSIVKHKTIMGDDTHRTNLALAQVLEPPLPSSFSCHGEMELFSPDTSRSSFSADDAFPLSFNDDIASLDSEDQIGAVPIRGPDYDPTLSRVELQSEVETSAVIQGEEAEEGQGGGSNDGDGEVLLTAELVKPPELVQAVELDLRQQEKIKRRRTIYALFMGAIIGALVAISTIITRRAEGKATETSQPNFRPPTSASSMPTLAPTPEPVYEWRQMGNVIRGTEYFQYFGYSVAMNRDGTVIGIGTDPDSSSKDLDRWISVYEYDTNNNEWIQFGTNSIPHPVGTSRTNVAADEIFLSDDGRKLTVFVSSENLIQQYELANTLDDSFNSPQWKFRTSRSTENVTNWTPGSFASGVPVTSFHGVAVSPDGEYVAINVNTNSSQRYVVNLGSNLVGYRMGGPIPLDRFGDISLSREGNVLAVGQSGHVMVYQYGRNGWILPPTIINGTTIESFTTTSSFGGSVAISGDGQTLAITDSRSHQDAGSISMYRVRKDDGKWQPTGFMIGNLNSAETLGIGGDVSISEDGAIVGVNSRTGWLNPGSTFYTFQYNGSWAQDGFVSDFNTDEYPCALSGDGTSLCCGSPFDLNEGKDTGLVTVYRYTMTDFDSPAPYNSMCSNATLLTIDHDNTFFSSQLRIHGDTSLAMIHTDLPSCDDGANSTIIGVGLWYQIDPTTKGNIGQYMAVSACSPKFPKYYPVRLTLFAGSSCENLICIQDHVVFCRDDASGLERDPLVWTTDSVDATTYFLFVHGEEEHDVGPFDIQLLSSPASNEGGRTCNDATPLLAVDGPRIFGTSVWAEHQVNCLGQKHRGRWYKVDEIEEDGYQAVSLCTTVPHWNSWTVSIFAGTCEGELNCIMAEDRIERIGNCENNEEDNQWHTTSAWQVKQGMQYFILVSGRENFIVGYDDVSYGIKVVSVKDLNPPPNDKCENAIELVVNALPIFGDGRNATHEQGCSERPFASKGVWYRIAAERNSSVRTDGGDNSTLTVTTCDDGTFNDEDIATAQLSIYQGSSCEKLTCLGSDYLNCNTVFALRWEETASLEEGYYILVETTKPFGIYVINGKYEIPYLDRWGRPYDLDKVVISI